MLRDGFSYRCVPTFCISSNNFAGFQIYRNLAFIGCYSTMWPSSMLAFIKANLHLELLYLRISLLIEPTLTTRQIVTRS